MDDQNAEQVINTVKVYPPSFIAEKTVLHLPKKALVVMDIVHIESIHIVFFVLFTLLLFIGMWKRPNLR
jgi:hypothetical protein